MSIDVPALISAARAWVGVPFQHQGRTRHGVDCLGLLACIGRQVGVWPPALEHMPRYGRSPTALLLEGLQAHCQRASGPFPGTILLMRFPQDALPRHVALSTGRTIIHAHGNARAVVEVSYTAQWPRQTHSCWRWPGVDYGMSDFEP